MPLARLEAGAGTGGFGYYGMSLVTIRGKMLIEDS
jgi:hypothetical protein